MIERYEIKEVSDIFSLKSRYEYFLKVELSVLKAYSTFNVIPKEDYLKIKEKAKINVKRINEIEEITRHDVIAFTRSISELLGEEKRWFHFNLTSTDVVDTANSLALKDANNLIYKEVNELLEILKSYSLKYKNTITIGRTHGMHAELTTFGFKFANFYSELKEAIASFNETRKKVEVSKISGAVGNYYDVDKEIESFVSKDLDLYDNSISTQVLSRTRYAYWAFSLTMISEIISKIALEIRHLSRSEVSEVKEGFKVGQKGSSAMPHKKNPISSENINGLSRLIKSYLDVSLENILLWHERDISHSSNERIYFLDDSTLIIYIIRRMKDVLNNLYVDETRMLENIKNDFNTIYSGRILNYLIKKHHNYSREELYDHIQPLTFKAMNEKEDFLQVLLNDEYFKPLINKDEIEDIIDKKHLFKGIEEAYKNIGLLD